MNVRSRFSQGLVVLLTATSLLGSQVLLPAAQVDSSPRVVDVSLSANGTLTGAVIDTRGQSRGKTTIEVLRGRRVVARTHTDSNGRYAVTNLPGGLYLVRVDGTETLVRAWAAGTAPRTSESQLQIVADATIVRGQDAPPIAEAAPSKGLLGGSGMSTGLTAALIVGGVVGAILIIDEIDDDGEDAVAPASP